MLSTIVIKSKIETKFEKDKVNYEAEVISVRKRITINTNQAPLNSRSLGSVFLESWVDISDKYRTIAQHNTTSSRTIGQHMFVICIVNIKYAYGHIYYSKVHHGWIIDPCKKHD